MISKPPVTYYQDRYNKDCWISFEKLLDPFHDMDILHNELGDLASRMAEHQHFFKRKFKPGDKIDFEKIQRMSQEQEKSKEKAKQMAELKKKEELKIKLLKMQQIPDLDKRKFKSYSEHLRAADALFSDPVGPVKDFAPNKINKNETKSTRPTPVQSPHISHLENPFYKGAAKKRGTIMGDFDEEGYENENSEIEESEESKDSEEEEHQKENKRQKELTGEPTEQDLNMDFLREEIEEDEKRTQEMEDEVSKMKKPEDMEYPEKVEAVNAYTIKQQKHYLQRMRETSEQPHWKKTIFEKQEDTKKNIVEVEDYLDIYKKYGNTEYDNKDSKKDSIPVEDDLELDAVKQHNPDLMNKLEEQEEQEQRKPTIETQQKEQEQEQEKNVPIMSEDSSKEEMDVEIEEDALDDDENKTEQEIEAQRIKNYERQYQKLIKKSREDQDQ